MAQNVDFCVDLYHKSGKECLQISLPATTLGKQVELDKWAKAALGCPCASKFDNASGKDLVLHATKIADDSGNEILPKGKICMYGRQAVDGSTVFVVSKEIMLSLSGEKIVLKTARF